MSVKQIKPLMTNAFLNAENDISDAAMQDKTEVVNLLLKAGASLSVVCNEVIKPSVKLRQSHINLFK